MDFVGDSDISTQLFMEQADNITNPKVKKTEGYQTAKRRLRNARRLKKTKRREKKE